MKNVLQDDGIYAWKLSVNWDDATKTRLDGPAKIPVAPYHYLGGGQLTNTVPQPGTDRRLDSQGDKIMARLVYRRIGDRESHRGGSFGEHGRGRRRRAVVRIPAGQRSATSCCTSKAPTARGGDYRWMASPAIDAAGKHRHRLLVWRRSTFQASGLPARLADDPLGILTLREAVLVEGEAAQTNTIRWEDYSQTAIDPSDDRTIWYVGDYLKKGAANYSTRIGAFRIAGPNR